MWSLYQQSKTWACRPSQLVGMEPGYRSFCFDEAVASWGSYIVNELEAIEGKTEKDISRKRRDRLLYLLDAPKEKRFRSMRDQVGTKKKSTKTS